MNTSVNKGTMSPMVTDPSLVNKTLRDLNAKKEELRQEATRTMSMMHSRDREVERRFREQEREITPLKCKNCYSMDFYTVDRLGSNRSSTISLSRWHQEYVQLTLWQEPGRLTRYTPSTRMT